MYVTDPHIFDEVDLCVTLILYPNYNISPLNVTFHLLMSGFKLLTPLDFGKQLNVLNGNKIRQIFRSNGHFKPASKMSRKEFELRARNFVSL